MDLMDLMDLTDQDHLGDPRDPKVQGRLECLMDLKAQGHLAVQKVPKVLMDPKAQGHPAGLTGLMVPMDLYYPLDPKDPRVLWGLLDLRGLMDLMARRAPKGLEYPEYLGCLGYPGVR